MSREPVTRSTVVVMDTPLTPNGGSERFRRFSEEYDIESPDAASLVYEYSTDNSVTETEFGASDEYQEILTADEAVNDVPLDTIEYVHVYEVGIHSDGDDPRELLTSSQKRLAKIDTE